MSNDTFIGTNGNDIFNGGHGTDTATFAGNAAGYRIDTLADGRIQIVDIDSSDGDTGSDTLTGIEALSFNDKSYTLSQTNSSAGETTIDTNEFQGGSETVMTTLADGGYVLAWKTDYGDGRRGDIYAQRFDAAGNAIGDVTEVNTFTSMWQEMPAITALDDGGYIIAWASYNQAQGDSQSDIYAKRFDANGTAVGAETLINTTIISNQTLPVITALDDGGYVVSWSARQGDYYYDVLAQRFDADGNTVGGEVRINTSTSNDQSNSAITALTDGGYLITWTSSGSTWPSSNIYAQRFDASGNAIGGETLVSTNTTGPQGDSVCTVLADGGYVISWVSAMGGYNDDVYAQRFDANGNKIGGNTRINTYTANDQWGAKIAALADGGYVITWQSSGQDGADFDYNIYAQRYDANGVAVGGETRISSAPGSSPAITALKDGGYAISWGAWGSPMHVQRFDANGNPWATLEISGTDEDDVITAGSGTQVLKGLAGHDTLAGGGGDDIYVLDDADTVIEAEGGGIDTIQAGFSYALQSNFENLTLTGTANINGTGNSANNVLTGNSADNRLAGGKGGDTLRGGDGNDELAGGRGNDTLDGGAGSDTAFFTGQSSAYRIDTLSDGRIRVVDIDFSDGDFGSDILDGIEVLAFSDRNYTLGRDWQTGETRATTSFDGSSQAIAGLRDGGYVLTWQFWDSDNESYEIVAQRYNANGNKVGAVIQVNSHLADDQADAAITALADGGYVITWTSTKHDGSRDGIYAQRFDADGTMLGEEARVNTYTRKSQTDSDIAALDDGGYVITWTSEGQDGSREGVYAQRFDANGNKVGAETRVNYFTSSSQNDAAVTALKNGGYVVSWGSYEYDIYAQRFDASGNKVGSETRINTDASYSHHNPDITALADGGYIIAWDSYYQGSDSDSGVYAQRYDHAGNAVGGETHINTYVNGDQNGATITAFADGGYLITWVSEYQDGSDTGIYAQRFDAAGNKMGEETRINTFTPGYQVAPSVAALTDGGYIISWVSGKQEGKIYTQRFDADGNAGGPLTITGTNGDDVIKAGAGSQILKGLDGSDTLVGGDGHDIYILEGADTIVEAENGGFDTLHSGASASLTANLEKLVLTGSANIDGNGNGGNNALVGNEGSNALRGGAGKDTLSGNGGNDSLMGGLGSDMLSGGRGNDVFSFATRVDGIDVDTIFGYTPGSDTLQLAQAVFKKLALGDLSTVNFVANATGSAVDGDDYIVYNSKTGELFYDSDGNGIAAALKFAKLTGAPLLTAADFDVI